MNNFIDIKTAILFSALMLLIVSFAMFQVRKRVMTYPGFGFWTAAAVLFMVVTVLAMFRGIAPDFITIVLMNALECLAVLLLIRGLAKFFDLPVNNWLDVAIMLVYLILFLYFTYTRPGIVARIVVNSGIIGLILIRCILLTRGPYKSMFGNRSWLLIPLLWTIVLVRLGRIGITLTLGSETESMMHLGLVHALYYMVLPGLVVALFICLVMLNNQRLDQDHRLAVEEIKTLQGLIPICSHCKKVRDDKGYWNQIEAYISQRTEAQFSHSICPECAEKYYPEIDFSKASKKR